MKMENSKNNNCNERIIKIKLTNGYEYTLNDVKYCSIGDVIIKICYCNKECIFPLCNVLWMEEDAINCSIN